MPRTVKCERNARPNTKDDRLLEIALLALATIQDCCGQEGNGPHEDGCAVASANQLLEYHAGILSREPASWLGRPVYSGELSHAFWMRVKAIRNDEKHTEVYALGCDLQNLEEKVLAALTAARS